MSVNTDVEHCQTAYAESKLSCQQLGTSTPTTFICMTSSNPSSLKKTSSLDNLDLKKELKLAHLRIHRLEVEAERAKQMQEYERNLRKIDDEVRSIKSDIPVTRFHENSRMKAVEDYISALPTTKHAHSDEVVIRGPALRVTVPKNDQDRVNETAHLFRACMSLPTKQLPRFNGSPRSYHSFMRRFVNSVERYTSDPTDLLNFLIQCCEGEAAEAIQQCAILDPDIGYHEAMRILERRFGEPHVIARTCIDELTDGPPLKPNDHTALIKLADSMKVCSITLKQLGYEPDLNATRTLRAIARRLPFNLQSRWCDLASSIFRDRREPTFDELTEFVNERADAANTRKVLIGDESVSIHNNISRPVPTKPSSNPQIRTMAISSQGAPSNTARSPNYRYQPTCLKCGGYHYVDQCSTFRALPYFERIDFVTTAGLCKLCIKPNHVPEKCRSRKVCGIDGCIQQHHPLLHRNNSSISQQKDAVSESPQTHLSVNSSAVNKAVVSLGILPVRIVTPGGFVTTHALLDSGSDSTLVSEGLIERLNLKGEKSVVQIGTVNGRNSLSSRRVQLQLLLPDLTKEVKNLLAWSVPTLPEFKTANTDPTKFTEWKHLLGIPLPQLNSAKVELLIGMDNSSMHWAIESRFGAENEPFAVRTPIGWVLLGPLGNKSSLNCQINNTFCVEDEVLFQLDALRKTEFSDIGVHGKGSSRDDQSALEFVEKSVKFRDGHYHIPVPWRAECPNLSSNKPVAHRRLQHLADRLVKDDNLRRLYTETMQGYLDRNYAETVSEPSDGDKHSVWYIPHHPVFHPQKPNKVRVVFDCACRFRGQSLNDQLLSGPDMTNSLFGVLLRFRESSFVFTADVEAMFHQVKLPETDRRYFRFLWWKDGDLSQPPTEYQMTVHPFGARSSPFCANFALRQTLRDQRKFFKENSSSQAEKTFYVDDCLCSSADKDELIAFAEQIKSAVLCGGFRLLKWSSNVPELLESLGSEERSGDALNLDLQPSYLQRMLGVQWDMKEDVFRVIINYTKEVPTKRRVLSCIASIYDPIGFTSPAVLPGRLLLQDLCKVGLKWDDELTGEHRKRWVEWTDSLQSMLLLRIPRCLHLNQASNDTVELHCFSDASSEAYGAVLYLRIKSVDGVARCGFVCGKSRVIPLKGITIPRLELTAAVLSARLALQVKEELSVSMNSTTFWTDSMIVLQALRNTTTRFPVFVTNRLSVIHQLSEVQQWRFVDGRQNPADLASRGLAPNRMVTSSWLNGPEFLRLDEHQWPLEPITAHETNTAFLTVTATSSDTSWFDRFIRFGSWIKLLRAVVWLRRFCNYIKNRRSVSDEMKQPITGHEIITAKLVVTGIVQRTVYSEELQLLQKGVIGKRVLRAKDSSLRELQPFIHDGLLRVGGRLKWALLPFDAKHPIILPRTHFVSSLIIQDAHKRLGHVGTSQVLSEVRQKYWIIQGQAAVKRVISGCYHCRRWHSRACQQVMSPLPFIRTKLTGRPFAYVGVDCFGPLLVKRGRSTEKRYGCIFTCMSIRAVHIEIVHSLETDSFLCAFSRFVSRRGSPQRVYSDNGMNFRGAEEEIKRCLQAWNQDLISDKLAQAECDWIFSTPWASHQGGVWERMIRSIRRILQSLLGGSLVNDETLQTLMTEVEKIINDRPLVRLTADPMDDAALTPNHLLLLHRNPAIQPMEPVKDRLTKRWKLANQLANMFWRRWQREYLPSLQTCYRWLKKGRNLKVGDLVLMVDYNCSRSQWKKGVVCEVSEAKDGAVRKVQVRTASGILRRDVRQLCLLEEHVAEEEGADQNVPVRSLVGEC